MKTIISLSFFILLLCFAGRMSAQPCPAGTTSSDTIFTKCSLNPVVQIGSAAWDNKEVESPCVIKNGSSYQMWYEGEDTATTAPRDYLGYATSNDGINWTKNTGWILSGVLNSWEHYGIAAPTVILDGATYKMWYCSADNTGIGRVGYATSSDGITWTKYAGNPIIPAGAVGAFDEKGVVAPHVIKDGSVYKMWYTGYDAGSPTINRIGYATSNDGITWTKSLSNPVINLGAAGAFDQYSAANPSVIKDGLVYKMWYNGVGPNPYKLTIGYASSADGIAWTRYPSPYVGLGATLSWDALNLGEPFIINDNSYKMWYAAYRADNKAQIGYASNPAGLGMEEASSDNNANIFPNPTSGVFNVQMGKFKNVQMKVYNVLGECIYQHIYTSANPLIDLSREAKGVYFYKILSEGKFVSGGKLILQ